MKAKLDVEVCVGTSCHLMGSQAILNYLEGLPQKIKVKINVSIVACMNKCKQGPAVRVGKKFVAEATPEKVKKAIEDELLGNKAGD